MGRTLGLLWAEKGHEVFFGARNKTNLDYIHSLTKAVKSGTLQEAVVFGDILFYSLRNVLPSSLAAKEIYTNIILIDPNNGEIPQDFNYPPRTYSYAEMYQNDIPQAFIAKAFNTMAQEIYYLPTKQLEKHNLISPFCANTSEAKQTVHQLIVDTGLIPLDCGTIRQGAHLLESFADLTRFLIIHKEMGAGLGFSYSVLPLSEHTPYGSRQPTNYT